MTAIQERHVADRLYQELWRRGIPARKYPTAEDLRNIVDAAKLAGFSLQ